MARIAHHLFVARRHAPDQETDLWALAHPIYLPSHATSLATLIAFDGNTSSALVSPYAIQTLYLPKIQSTSLSVFTILEFHLTPHIRSQSPSTLPFPRCQPPCAFKQN